MSTIVLTDSDGDRSIEAHPGDEIVVRLPENPTTGFRWQVDQEGGILDQVGDGYIEAEPVPPDAEPVFGRGSLRELRFRARAPGVARLELKNLRAWEGEGSMIGRFATDIVVSERPSDETPTFDG